MWFLWQEPVLLFSLGSSRLHLDNLRRDARATFCVGEDLERDGSGRGTVGAVAFGRAAITTMDDDEAFVRATTEAVLGRYRPTDESIVWAEDRAIVTPRSRAVADVGEPGHRAGALSRTAAAGP